MKIATGIIGLVMMLIIGIQSMAVYAGGSIIKNSSYAQGGSVGLVVTFLFLIASAFSFAKPMVSMVVFLISAFLGIASGATTPFHDMTVWGVLAVVLAVMSFFAWRGDITKRANQTHSA